MTKGGNKKSNDSSKESDSPEKQVVFSFNSRLEYSLLACNPSTCDSVRIASDGHKYLILPLFDHNRGLHLLNIGETDLATCFLNKFLNESPPIDFQGKQDITIMLNFRKLIEVAKSYEQFFVTRDSSGNLTNFDKYKISEMLVNSLPEDLKPRLKSVIKLQFKLKMEKDPQIDPHLWNKNDHRYTKITELKQFPDIVEYSALNFKYMIKGDESGTLHNCLPISEWILPVPIVSTFKPMSDSFNIPSDSPVKKARTIKDL